MLVKRIGLRAAALVTLVLLVSACAGGPSPAAPQETAPLSKNSDGYIDVTVEQLVDVLESQDVILVNVHIPFEGDLPGTDLSIPFSEIGDHLDKLPDKEAAIVLYCRSGSMSTSAAKELAALGYTNVMELDGGFRAWGEAGHELVGP